MSGFDCLVVGRGIVGLAHALAAARAGRRVGGGRPRDAVGRGLGAQFRVHHGHRPAGGHHVAAGPAGAGGLGRGCGGGRDCGASPRPAAGGAAAGGADGDRAVRRRPDGRGLPRAAGPGAGGDAAAAAGGPRRGAIQPARTPGREPRRNPAPRCLAGRGAWRDLSAPRCRARGRAGTGADYRRGDPRRAHRGLSRPGPGHAVSGRARAASAHVEQAADVCGWRRHAGGCRRR